MKNLYQTLIGTAAGILLAASVLAAPSQTSLPLTPAPTMETVQHKAFDFFWNESDPTTGLTKDRAVNRGGKPDTYTVASTAATGYALAAQPVGVSHGWVRKDAAYARALMTLQFVHDKLDSNHGFYYHFLDKSTGKRVWNCELSSIDTALLLLGARVAGDYWPGTQVQQLSDDLTRRVDWTWMQASGKANQPQKTLSMGWKPETGWIDSRWQGYSEASYLYWLALGSGSRGLAPDSWDAWDVKPAVLEDFPVFGGADPLFMAQMAPGYYDVRGKHDRQGRGWWTAWQNAHLADWTYCKRNPDGRKTYAEGFWGITACDQPPPVGYGANWPAAGHDDGTVAPTAMLSGVMFVPAQAKAALTNLWTKHRDQIWGRYGFSNAFNVDKNWYDSDVVGIDLGMTLLAIENAQSGLIWHLLERDPVIAQGLSAAGFPRTRAAAR
ncbi:MAG: glucoamylase family protein [Janthinobacterium lividum]